MKCLLPLLALLITFAVTSCESTPAPAEAKSITGYPVYKFLNFGGIDKRALNTKQKEAREFLGDNYEAYVDHHQLFVSAGFDRHTPLRVITKGAREVEIYVRNADYRKLWKTSPHDLNDQGKSHLIHIEFKEIKVGNQIINRASSFRAELVNHKPTIRK